MSLIHQDHHAVLMGQLHYPLQVGANSIICGIVNQDGHCIRILLDGAFHLRNLHTQGYSQMVICLGIDIYGCGAVHNQRVDYAAVHVARHDYLLAALAGSQHHRLNR